MAIIESSIPSEYLADISKAVEILKEEGCTEIFIFGSIVNGKSNEISDIDIAVRGLPASKYFKIVGKLILELNNSVDLVDLDETNNNFVKILEKEGLIRVA